MYFYSFVLKVNQPVRKVLSCLSCFCLSLTHAFWLCVLFTHLDDDGDSPEVFFFFCSIAIATVRGSLIVNTEIQSIVSSDSLRCTIVVTAQTLSLYSLSVSHFRAWLVQVAGRRLSVVVVPEVEYVQVKRLITQHLRPFFASPFMLQPIISKTLANQK